MPLGGGLCRRTSSVGIVSNMMTVYDEAESPTRRRGPARRRSVYEERMEKEEQEAREDVDTLVRRANYKRSNIDVRHTRVENVDWLTGAFRYLATSGPGKPRQKKDEPDSPEVDAKSQAPEETRADAGPRRSRFCVPLTLVFRHMRPHAWYESKHGVVIESQVDETNEDIVARFVAAADEAAGTTATPCDILGQYIYTKGKAGAEGARRELHRPAAIYTEYFDARLMLDFLRSRARREGYDGMLQLFVAPSGGHSAAIRAQARSWPRVPPLLCSAAC